MKTIRLFVVYLLFAVVALSCTFFNKPQVNEGPGFEVWTATDKPVVEETISVDILPPEPTEDQTVYARAQVGSYLLSIWLTYDPLVWDAPAWLNGNNQLGEPVQQLSHKSLTGCSFHDSLGHGLPETWTYGSYTKALGGVIFQIDQWTDNSTNNPALVIYQYPTGQQTNSSKRLELEPGSMPYDCIAATEVVLGLSAADFIR